MKDEGGTTIIPDPKNYREMSLPLGDEKAAKESINGLFNELKALRRKYKVRDMHVIVADTVLCGGDEAEVMSSAHFGDPLRAEMMCAWGMAKSAITRKDLVKMAIESGTGER